VKIGFDIWPCGGLRSRSEKTFFSNVRTVLPWSGLVGHDAATFRCCKVVIPPPFRAPGAFDSPIGDQKASKMTGAGHKSSEDNLDVMNYDADLQA
jgi:hypothetical protein